MPQFLTIGPSSWKLTHHSIHLWAVSLASEAYDFTLLSVEEIEKARRFHFEKHRRRYVHARKSLRILLGKYLDCSPASLVFASHEHGKPYLHDNPIYFNVSHSGDWALLGFCQHREIGVDIECYSARDFIGIASTAFSEVEQTHVRESPPYLRCHTFFTIWSQKEAFIKACGQGLYYPTQSFTVNPHATEASLITEKCRAQNWQLLPFMFRCGVSAALCYPANYSPSIQRFDFSIIRKW